MLDKIALTLLIIGGLNWGSIDYRRPELGQHRYFSV